LIDLSRGDPSRLEQFRHSLGPDWQLERAEPELELQENAYDVVLAINLLEQEENPLVTLGTIKRLLRTGGLALIATPNTNSGAAQAFRGRHWSGYDFPRRRNLFRVEVLALSAEQAGLDVTSMRTIAEPLAWVESVRALLVDWGAPRWTQTGLARSRRAALAGSVLLEWIQQRRGKGGILVATLQQRAS
jgi:SAM-dependent methyltransferase